jgi:two-component system, sensor histidine kinase
MSNAAASTRSRPEVNRALVLRWGLIAALGFGLNWFAPEMAGGFGLPLGAFAYFLLFRHAPLLLTLPLAALANLPLVGQLEHLILWALLSLELVVLTLAHRRRWAQLPVWMFFWATLGAAAGWWFYRAQVPTPSNLAWLSHSGMAITTLLAFLFSGIVVRYTVVGRWISPQSSVQEPPLRLTALNYALALTLCPIVLLSAATFILVDRSGTREINNRLSAVAEQLGNGISLFFESHMSAIEQIAAQSFSEEDPEALDRRLEATRQAFPSFITLLATDASGQIIAAAPSEMRSVVAGQSVADRSYFQVPKSSGRPYISGVFQGRGFGNDRIVACSTPLFAKDGSFAGVVEGSVSVERLSAWIESQAKTRLFDVVVADRDGRLIEPGRYLQLEPLDSLIPHALGRFWKDRPASLVYDVWRDGSPLLRLISHHRREPVANVVVIAQKPQLDALELMLPIAAAGAVFAMLIVGAAFWIARLAQSHLAAPLEEFAAEAELMSSAQSLVPLGSATRRLPREVRVFLDSFNRLVHREQAARQQLIQINQNLDRLVRERTADLERARTAAEEAQVAAEQANASKGSFLAMVSHEVRTPLNSIIGMAEATLDNPAAGSVLEKASLIRNNGQALLELVNDLLDLSRIEAGKFSIQPEWFDPATTVRETASMLSSDASRKGLALLIGLDGVPSIQVLADPRRFQQCVLNLASNAVKFTTKGRVSIRLKFKPDSESEGWLYCSVEDTGPGIRPDDRDRIFEPFYRVEASAAARAPGTGLGLPITRQLAELMGGKIELSSQPGHSSTFTLSVPVKWRRTPATATAAATLHGLRVLAIDDNPDNLQVLEASLIGSGIELVTADSAERALELLMRGDFDAVVVDLHMPRINGFQLAETIRALPLDHPARRCRLIASSAHSANEVADRCAASGFVAYIEKPVTRRRLREELAKAVRPAPEDNSADQQPEFRGISQQTER